MNILHIKSIKLKIKSCVSVVLSGDFCRCKLALPSLLFLSVTRQSQSCTLRQDWNNSDGKADLKRQNLLETDTQDVNKLLILRVKCSYFKYLPL